MICVLIIIKKKANKELMLVLLGLEAIFVEVNDVMLNLIRLKFIFIYRRFSNNSNIFF